MFLSAIFLDLGVHVLHQRVPLHQHVRERRTGEDAHHLWQKKKKSLNLKCIYFERKHTAILEEDTTLQLKGGISILF